MKFNFMAVGKLALIATAAQLVVVQQGLASGFEKGIMWGGRSAGVGGIASPYIAGSQALYFNPAGLANDKEGGQDVAFNLTLLQAKFKGPINNTNEQITSSDKLLTPLGLTYSYQANDRLGFGLGYFVSGGANAAYDDVTMPIPANANAKANIKTDLLVSEVSLGAGYKVTDDFKIGVAYRIVMAKAEFGLITRRPDITAGAYANTQLTDLKATDYSGFRLGAQYKVSDATKIGFNYRSEVNLSADGTLTNTVNAGAAPAVQPSAGATVKTTFPMQAQLGVVHEYTEWRALAEYVWTQYSRVGDIGIDSGGTRNNVKMNWYDENQVRLGGEYLGMNWPIRFGYVWTSSVTNKDNARATFAPPAAASTFTLGTGQIFQAFGNPLQFDVAGEYTFASGDGGTAQSGDTVGDFRAGTYAVNAMAAHLGLTYAF